VLDFVGDVDNVYFVGCVEGEVFGMGFHGIIVADYVFFTPVVISL
jgi:hypothetical protein